MDSLSDKQKMVKIGDQSYALDQIPDECSAVVLAEKKKLVGSIDLKTLVTDLGRVGGFIRVAYNGIGAAGPKFTKQQIEIQRLGYDITKLCDKSAVTVAKFKRASSCILSDLQSTYEYLLENMEELAVDTLSAVSKLAGDMQKAALELKCEFEEEEKKVIMALESTQKSKGDEALKIIQLQNKQREMEEEKKKEFALMKEHQAKEHEAEMRRRELEQKEDRAMAEIGKTNFFASLVNGLTTRYLGTKFLDMDSLEGQEKKAEKLRQARLEALATEQTIREKRHEALARMTSFTSKIQQCRTEENMAECAVEALHEAVGALKELSAVMMQAALFWEQMQLHCKSLAESEMKERVEKALELYTDEKRLKVWTSPPFKRQAVEFYAGWVALNSVCNEYMEQIKLTQQDLYCYISENPSYEESRAKIKELAQTFLKDLTRDQKALTDKEFEAHKEMKALGKPHQ